MSLQRIRFRVDGELCILQVLESQEKRNHYDYDRAPEWRDAQPTDLLEVSKFTRDTESTEARVDSLEYRIQSVEARAHDHMNVPPYPSN